jgi:hypothetical protein
MRRVAACLTVALGLALAHEAAAQDNSIAIPPAPAIVAAPDSANTTPLPPAEQPPGLVQAPTPPMNTDGAAANQAAAPSPPAQTTPPQPPNTWVAGTTAKLGVLNKVDGSVSAVSIPVGGQANIGDLTVNVLACFNRPANQIPDTAIFLNAQSTNADPAVPTYRGWMVLSAPGAAVVGDAGETFRVIACS